MKGNLICAACGAIMTEESAYYFDGRLMCGECFEQETVECDCCHNRVWSDDATRDEGMTVCPRCCDDYYVHCENCGRIIHQDRAYYENNSDYPYCYDCYMELEEKYIKSYNYKPEPTFYGSGDLFYGVELEIDKGGEYEENAEALLRVANARNNALYAKHDGSINNGFELVSEPATLEYHLHHFGWREIFEKAIAMEYSSHNTETCGLHIHVSRSAFGKTYEEQETVVARIVHFVEKNWLELVKFSRRTERNLDRWAARYATISAEVCDTYKKAKDKHLGRYVAVNLENSATIEFRLFRGTLRHKTFIATLQLVDEICKTAINLSDKEFEQMSWGDFVVRIDEDKPELIDYLKSKRLYVNEVTSEGAEE